MATTSITKAFGNQVDRKTRHGGVKTLSKEKSRFVGSGFLCSTGTAS